MDPQNFSNILSLFFLVKITIFKRKIWKSNRKYSQKVQQVLSFPLKKCDFNKKSLNFELQVIFTENYVKHTKQEPKSFKARNLRGKKRMDLGEILLNYKYPSKLYHEYLADDNQANMQSGLLKVNSKNVSRQAKYETVGEPKGGYICPT